MSEIQTSNNPNKIEDTALNIEVLFTGKADPSNASHRRTLFETSSK